MIPTLSSVDDQIAAVGSSHYMAATDAQSAAIHGRGRKWQLGLTVGSVECDILWTTGNRNADMTHVMPPIPKTAMRMHFWKRGKFSLLKGAMGKTAMITSVTMTPLAIVYLGEASQLSRSRYIWQAMTYQTVILSRHFPSPIGFRQKSSTGVHMKKLAKTPKSVQATLTTIRT